MLTLEKDAYYRLTGNLQEEDFGEGTGGSCLPLDHWNDLLRGEPRTYETRCKNGSWVLCSALPTKDEHGNIDAVIGVVTNIESQKRAEQEAVAKVDALERARAAEQRFYRFLEIVPAGILIVSTDGKGTFATDEWFRLSGCLPCSFDQINWFDCVIEEDRETLQQAWKTLVVEARAVNIQVRVHRLWSNSAGEKCGNAWIMCKALPEFKDDGSVEQIVSAITDISHLKFAEAVQRERVAEAVERRRQQENFVDLVSHEVCSRIVGVRSCERKVAYLSRFATLWEPSFTARTVSGNH